jgi:hypothetical protein
MIYPTEVPKKIRHDFDQALHKEATEELIAYPIYVRGSRRSRIYHVGWQAFVRGRADFEVAERRAALNAPVITYRGPVAESIRAAEAAICDTPQRADPDKSYELRALRIPAHYIQALWLRGPGRDGVLVPYLAYDDDELRELTLVPETVFMDIINRLSERRPVYPLL